MQLPKSRYAVTDKNHKYQIEKPDGTLVGPLRNVTGISGMLDKPALKGWAARMAADYFKAEILRLGNAALTPEALNAIAYAAKNAHAKKAKDAADLGTKCHAIFEAIIQGKEPAEIPAELAEPAKDFMRWRLSTDIELVGLEVGVASLFHLYGGRIDAVGYSQKRGGFGIVDYKTSSGFYGNEYAYQCGGYAQAFEEQYATKIKWIEIVRFGKAPPYDSEARPVVDLPKAIEGFLRLKDVAVIEREELIGAPSFTTSQERAEEANAKAKAQPKVKKVTPAQAAAGF